MNKALKQAKATAYLRQLCCSGLNKQAVIQEFLVAVKNVLPSDGNIFFDTEKKFAPSDLFSEHGYDIFPELTNILENYWTPARIVHFAAWFKEHPVFIDPTVLDAGYYKSEFYNYAFCKFGWHHMVIAPVIYLGRPIGTMTLQRSREMQAFNAHEEALLVRLMPYVAYAMHNSTNKAITYCEQGTTGLMVMDTQGMVLHQCQTANKLLNLASNPVITLDTAERKTLVLAKLAQVCRNLNTIFLGGDAAPPSWCLVNGLGCFVFRAFWLDNQMHEPSNLIGMSVEHQEPLLLKILRALEHAPLSPIQKEVAALVAQGASNEKISQHLHIKRTTTKDHVSNILARLDIEGREELLPKLLANGKERLLQLM